MGFIRAAFRKLALYDGKNCPLGRSAACGADYDQLDPAIENGGRDPFQRFHYHGAERHDLQTGLARRIRGGGSGPTKRSGKNRYFIVSGGLRCLGAEVAPAQSRCVPGGEIPEA